MIMLYVTPAFTWLFTFMPRTSFPGLHARACRQAAAKRVGHYVTPVTPQNRLSSASQSPHKRCALAPYGVATLATDTTAGLWEVPHGVAGCTTPSAQDGATRPGAVHAVYAPDHEMGQA